MAVNKRKGGRKPLKPRPRKPRKPKKPPKLGGARLRWYMELRKRRRQRSIAILTAPNPAGDLLQDPHIANAIVWRQPWGAVEPYSAWEMSRKRQLLEWCDRILAAGTGQAAYAGLPEAPPLKVTPTGAEGAFTCLDSTDAWQYYIAHVAQSLVVESQHWVPWSLVDFTTAELTMLFDSVSLFMWDAARRGYRIIFGSHGAATPGDPFRTYAFLETNHLIGTHARGTVEQVLGWCHRNLRHYHYSDDAANYVRIWQYAGYPPVERMLSGTDAGPGGAEGFAHWTAGCWGTNAFLRAVLRTVNIPVGLDIAGSHALPRFVREMLHLSHGDDPYGALSFATPPIPSGEFLIDEPTFQAWFGPAVSYDDRGYNVGRRMREVALVYLPGYVLQKHCEDVQNGTDHAHSQVRGIFGRDYSLEALEAANLWGRMDAKIAGFGGCGHVPWGE